MKTGTIKSFNHKKGIGFIISDSDNSEIFFRKCELNAFITGNEKVCYDESMNSLGKIAINIKVNEDCVPEKKTINIQSELKKTNCTKVIR